MRKNNLRRNLTLAEALLTYFLTIFIWKLFFSLFDFEIDNVDFLAWGASAISIYCITRTFIKPDFFGRYLKFPDVAEISFVSITTLLTGIGCWSLLVYLDVLINGDFAVKRWGLISTNDFAEVRWSESWLIGQLFVSCVLVPIIEEIVFRGFILHRLRERYNSLCSITISAIIFAFFHFNTSFIGAFIHGIIFGLITIRMSSLYAPIVVHSLYNLAIFVLTTIFGFSIVGDMEKIAFFSYWKTEMLCGLVGLLFMFIYFIFFRFRSHAEFLTKLDSSIET